MLIPDDLDFEEAFKQFFCELSEAKEVERVMGFEPTTPCLGSKHSTAELHPQTSCILLPKRMYVKMSRILLRMLAFPFT